MTDQRHGSAKLCANPQRLWEDISPSHVPWGPASHARDARALRHRHARGYHLRRRPPPFSMDDNAMRGPSATSATTRKGRRDGRRDPWLRFSEAGWHANGSQSYDQARVHPLHRSSAPHRVSLVAAAAQTL